MIRYTPFEWLCVDVANQFGLDKKLFEERIQWVKENFFQLMLLDSPSKERPLYAKAVMGLMRACRGEAIGHVVGLDATCSGMSIMSVLTKCIRGCMATNLIDPDKRNDAYTMVTQRASDYLGGGMVISRADAKNGVMTALYGSQKTPRDIFGEDSPELDAFYKGLTDIAPGAVELLDDLRNAWQPYALEHRWVMPDNFHVVIKVMQKVGDARVEIDELGHSSFSLDYYVNEGSKKDLKLVANVTHSFDAYLLRSVERRCHYNPREVRNALQVLLEEQIRRKDGGIEEDFDDITETVHVYIARWFDCKVPDAVIFGHLHHDAARLMDSTHIQQLIRIANEMLSYPPFEIITVHDEFKCHPNNCNQMRMHYANILGDLAEGYALEDVFQQITGVRPHYANAHDPVELANLIRNSNYALS